MVKEKTKINGNANLSNKYAFGTFKGVYVPSILTLLGVIMYLRFGWVLGNVGLTKTLLIVTISTSITFLTGLSISSLATNMKVGGGGAYYIISRSLGIEAGAAVGLPLYFAQTLGIAFYVSGFAESVQWVFPMIPYKIVAIITLFALALLAYISADIAIKAQLFILATISISLVSFFMGHPLSATVSSSVLTPSTVSFWVVFAVFFPAVTGIEAGLAMSGDLKNPEKSLPFGTLAAIFTSYLIYLAIPIFLSLWVKDKNLLLTNSFIMKSVAKWSPIIILGVWGASLSSALGALLGAPRTLQALARDKIIPSFLAKGFGKGGDPRIALGISFSIALGGIILGDLNIIAPILSMFFLTSYGTLNLSAALENLIGSPSWRPKFKINWIFSMIGAMGCFVAMFMINPGATFIAILISGLVYAYVQRKELNAHWGDIKYGILMLILNYIIYKLEDKKPDERTWRPNLMVLAGPPQSRWHLIEFANSIVNKRGFLTVNTILTEPDINYERISKLRQTVRNYLKNQGILSLVNIHRSSSILQGAQELVTTYGFGPIVPNTILLGDTEKAENFLEYAKLIKQTSRKNKNLILLRKGALLDVEEKKNGNIEIFMGGNTQNASLMLALSHLLKSSQTFHKSKMIIKTIVSDISEISETMTRVEEFIKRERLDAKSAVIIHDTNTIFETIAQNTKDARIVFMGLRPPLTEESDESYSHYYQNIIERTENFPTTVMVLASENIEFKRIFDSV